MDMVSVQEREHARVWAHAHARRVGRETRVMLLLLAPF